MLILLPPSEGKAAIRRGKPLDLRTLGFASLTATRQSVLTGLLELCHGDPEVARQTLGLTTGQADDVRRNAGLADAPTAPAGRIYTGVLYEALGLDGLAPAAKRRAATRVAIASALFGLLRPGDRVPAYRLSGTVNLPGLGPLSQVWRQPLGEVIAAEAQRGLVVDLRSGTYANFWRPAPYSECNVVSVQVMQEVNGVRTVVSHFNKATKGALVAQLLTDGANPATAAALDATLRRLGWRTEFADGPRARPARLDVIV